MCIAYLSQAAWCFIGSDINAKTYRNSLMIRFQRKLIFLHNGEPKCKFLHFFRYETIENSGNSTTLLVNLSKIQEFGHVRLL